LYDLRVTILRGTARIIAAATGLLLVYATVYALEGMTTRIPIIAARELVVVSLWTAPWMLLFFSGVEDFAIFSGREPLLWLGAAVALLFLYYFDWHTSLSFLTKTAMPPLAVAVGLVPHFVRQVKFLFVLSSVAAGAAGAFVLYHVANVMLSPTTHFATTFIELGFVTFGVASIIVGVLAIFDVYRKLTHRYA
jgi:hypothetical protein